MKKRNLFDELMEGVDALKAEREGKITLKRIQLEQHEMPVITPGEIPGDAGTPVSNLNF